jgi:hypothetical protein
MLLVIFFQIDMIIHQVPYFEFSHNHNQNDKDDMIIYRGVEKFV